MSLLTSIAGASSAWTTAAVKARTFARVDDNADGAIDKTELQTAFDAVAARTGREARDAAQVIARMDKDGDGAVTRLEIRAHLHELKTAPASTVDLAAKSR